MGVAGNVLKLKYKVSLESMPIVKWSVIVIQSGLGILFVLVKVVLS